MSDTSLTRQLAAYGATLRYDDLPRDVVAMAKALTIDSLGTALAARTLGEGCREVVDVMTALGGASQSSIIGSATKIAAPNAAFANGALVHALNYDVVGHETGHLGVNCLTAPLAAAEAHGPIDGRTFIAAVVAAAEITARVTGAVMEGGRLFSDRLLAGQYFGYFGAAAGAGRILGLDAVTMHSAFGLALMQVSGARQVTVGGDPPAKAIYGAYPNHGGVLAAWLARAGLGAEIDALDGAAGFYANCSGGKFNRETLIADLGTRFSMLRGQFKPWAASGVVIPFIEAGIELATRYDLRPGDVAGIEVVGVPAMRNWCEPLDERRRPSNGAVAANSTIFGAAKALAHRAVVLADFAPDGLRDPVALTLTARATYRYDDAVDHDGGVLNVRTTEGRELQVRVDKPLGHPSRPMTIDQLAAKFRDCCTYAPGITPAQATALLAFVDRLEDASDIVPLAAAPT